VDPVNGYGDLRAETSRCDCGAVSEPLSRDDLLTEWEASHVQWHCPLPTDREYDEHTETWSFPTLPSFVRQPAELTSTTDHLTVPGRLRSTAANALVASHTQEPTP
jgi:hypothetical protein